MENHRTSAKSETREVTPRAAAPRPGLAEQVPHVYRRKIDCEGSPEVEERQRTVRGARYPVRDRRSIY
jgi:hypothetical protein